LLPGSALYGTTSLGGSLNLGTVFSLLLQPQLTIERDGSVGFFIRFTSVPDITYRVQRAPSVTGTWSDLATNTAPATGRIEYHEMSPPAGQALYRAVQP
jgi:uncharacterized repeat protein (TIGR03803 family)